MHKLTITAAALLAFVATAHAGDPKAGVKVDAKADVKVGAKVKPAEPAAEPMAMPDPAPEVAAALKAKKGTWRCTGEMFDNPENPEVGRKTRFTIKVTPDLDKHWIKSSFVEAKQKGLKYPFKFTSYATYSAADSKWHSVMVDNWGGTSTGWSTGPDAAGKTVWEMEMSMMGMTSKFRDYEEPGEKKRTSHMWGEMSMDGGKTWKKVYDSTCKK